MCRDSTSKVARKGEPGVCRPGTPRRSAEDLHRQVKTTLNLSLVYKDHNKPGLPALSSTVIDSIAEVVSDGMDRLRELWDAIREKPFHASFGVDLGIDRGWSPFASPGAEARTVGRRLDGTKGRRGRSGDMRAIGSG